MCWPPFDRDLGARDVSRVIAAREEDRAGDVRGYLQDARQQHSGLGPVGVALAFGRHGVARADDYAPAGIVEALDEVIARDGKRAD